jgi:hypothetical protein
MLKTFAVTLVTISLFTGTANARGGGGAEPMPLTSFTDLPRYCPCQPLRRIMPGHKITRLHHSSAHNRSDISDPSGALTRRLKRAGAL